MFEPDQWSVIVVIFPILSYDDDDWSLSRMCLWVIEDYGFRQDINHLTLKSISFNNDKRGYVLAKVVSLQTYNFCHKNLKQTLIMSVVEAVEMKMVSQ